MELHQFTLKSDGKIYLVENMPEKPKYGKWRYQDSENMRKDLAYGEALQSAIDSAVEVSNQEEVLKALDISAPLLSSRQFFSLECSVEKQKVISSPKWYALVTFPESGEKKDRDWVEDFTHENGNYMNKCANCGEQFKGHKRRPLCKVCGSPLEKKEQEETQEQAIIDFAQWYSGMDREKVKTAYKRYINETRK
jgi:hypothetical protein